MSKQEIKEKIRETIQTDPRKRLVKRVALFGSYQKNTATDKSDIDILIEFKESVGFFDLMNMQRRLSDQLEKKVDLVTPLFLHRYFRDEVVNSAEIVYD